VPQTNTWPKCVCRKRMRNNSYNQGSIIAAPFWIILLTLAVSFIYAVPVGVLVGMIVGAFTIDVIAAATVFLVGGHSFKCSLRRGALGFLAFFGGGSLVAP
jgi:uncharacterized membrane protein